MSTLMEVPAVPATTVSIDETAIAEIASFAPTLLKDANELTIGNEGDYLESLVILETAVNREETIKGFFAETVNLAFKLHRSLTSRVNYLIAPYVAIQSIVKAKRNDYRFRMDQADKKREQDLRDLARKQAEDQALAEAAELEKQGEKEAAEFILHKAATAPTPAIVVPPTVQKQAGSTVKKVWTFRIDDPAKIPEQYKIIDESKIRRVVQALGNAHAIPGVTAYQEDQEAIRRKPGKP
jgi:hypothetical protein